MIQLGEIKAHYEHAKKKHPLFAHRLAFGDAPTWERRVSKCQWIIENANAERTTSVEDVLMEEVAELCLELARGDRQRIVAEALDVIAVCLRTIDVARGEQQLGGPAEAADA